MYVSLSVNEILNHPENWIHPIVWKMGDLEIPTWAKFNMTFETVKNLIFNGTPTEEESDVCISSILDKVSTKSCKIPTKCEIMLLRNDNPKGYALTHRVLLIWIASTVSTSLLKKGVPLLFNNFSNNLSTV